ncbi:chitin-binding protein [Salpingoeca rosetta]|uniref:Chitin-binding protein n=1 Tax=Salpingoeca rosetta (strain ATCC 50818 / BSB-021) TaxID=946362 RepID=F2TWZ6_SALR5|nr:chitin-binding protein [Salpingoeca rosetta]EGD75905.1 chitin-binding protein [Salpingoeca rosetta]|eukprot:XP_004998081.1 chitin-binding protein [Salpingoeca rosetta]
MRLAVASVVVAAAMLFAAAVTTVPVALAQSDPCSQTCTGDTYEETPCVDPVPSILLDYEAGVTQPDITVVGDWNEFEQSGDNAFFGFFGDHFYLLNRVRNTGYGMFSFSVDREADYNISISYVYFSTSPGAFTDSQRYDVHTDGSRAGTFYIDQQQPPPDGNLTLLGQFHIEQSGYVFLNATVKDTSQTTVTASLDAVYITPADQAVADGSPPVCLPLRVCQDYEYETVAATATSNRQCALVRNCTVSVEYETVAPTATSNRDCATLRTCNATEYETVAPTPTSNRDCAIIEVCADDQYETQAPTPTSDRFCDDCDVCDDATQITDANCTSTTNTMCRNITEPYQYSPWSDWSQSCGTQERTRVETCADVKCLDQKPTRQTRSINGGCDDVCDDTMGQIECSCTPPSYLIDAYNCSSVYCDIPTIANATASATGQLRLDEQALITCSSGYESVAYGTSFTITCTEMGLMNDTETCDDVDECAVNNGGCADMCTNLPGTFCCSQDGVYVYSEWSDWSTTCGEGTRTRTRTCNATCGGSCTNDQPLMETRDICCPVNANYTYGPFPDWMPTCARQTRERPESCTASCGGVCTNRINTTQVLTNGGCEQICNATSGAIVCDCDPGYRLTSDNATCEEFNPCDENNGGCSHTCVAMPLGQFECTCPSGFEAVDGFNCEDVDECAVNNGGCFQNCNNTAGDYFCSCVDGFMVDPSNSSHCVRINCANPPPTLPASIPSVTARLNGTGPYQFGDELPYVCEDGFTVDGGAASATSFSLFCRASGMVDGQFADGCVDVDECSTNNGGCTDGCVNFAGGFNCTCPTGYRLTDGFRCVEINECMEDSPCDHICTNTAGSFECACRTGFFLETSDNRTCTRVPCGPPPAEQLNATASNSAPAVAVYEDVVVYNCYDGYTTNGDAGGSSFFFAVCQASGVLSPLVSIACLDVDECLSSPCDQLCDNTLGSFTCSCLPGYTNTSATTCEDIDECDDPSSCALDDNTMCVNTDGAFTCECIAGYTRYNNTCQQQTHNLLDPLLSSGVVASPTAPQRFADDWVYFDGKGALEITQPLFIGETFSLTAQVQIVPGTGGYIFAVTSATGSTRHFALYVYELTQRVGVYYRTDSDASTLAVFQLDSPLDDGALHNIVLNVQAQSVSLQIDANTTTYTQNLGATISFCDPGPDCKIYIGQRASSAGGAYRLEGIIRHLRINALSTSDLVPIEDYPSPSAAGPSVIDLLDASNRNVVGSVSADADGALVFDGQSAVVIPRFHAVPLGATSTFTVTLTVNQDRNTNGYFVAKTDAIGGRFWSLYSSATSNRVSFYYKTSGSTAQQSASFSVSLADGLYHRVMLAVNNATAQLYVDGSLAGTSSLSGRVQDCSPPSSSCILQLGRRTDASSSDGLFFLSGAIASASVYSGVFMTADPTAVAPTPALDQQLPISNASGLAYLDLLNDTVGFSVGAVRGTEGATFDGSSRLEVTEHSFSLGPTLSVVGTLRADTGTAGYIFAKTSQDGNTRHLALYMSALSRLTLYYTSTASTSSRNLLFFPDVQLADGVVHSFLLQLVYTAQTDTTAVNLYVDGRMQTQQSFQGQLTDCGARSATCGLAVGQRLDDNAAGGAFGMTGLIQLLQLFPHGQLSLADAPSVSLASPPYFSVLPAHYIPGQNQGGAYREGVSLEACARMCLDDALCLSFDAGTVGGSMEGSCFLSYVAAGDTGATALVESSLFAYYERLS